MEFFNFGALVLTGIFVIGIMVAEDFIEKNKKN